MTHRCESCQRFHKKQNNLVLECEMKWANLTEESMNKIDQNGCGCYREKSCKVCKFYNWVFIGEHAKTEYCDKRKIILTTEKKENSYKESCWEEKKEKEAI